MTDAAKIVIMALGNSFRGDDAVGANVINVLKEQLPGCQFIEGKDDSLAILNSWEDAELAILVDAAQPDDTPGKIIRLELDEQPLPHDMASCSSHGLGLAEAIELGKAMNRLPGQMIIYAIQAASFDHAEPLSAAVSKAVDQVCDRIKNDVNQFINTRDNAHA